MVCELVPPHLLYRAAALRPIVQLLHSQVGVSGCTGHLRGRIAHLRHSPNVSGPDLRSKYCRDWECWYILGVLRGHGVQYSRGA